MSLNPKAAFNPHSHIIYQKHLKLDSTFSMKKTKIKKHLLETSSHHEDKALRGLMIRYLASPREE